MQVENLCRLRLRDVLQAKRVAQGQPQSSAFNSKTVGFGKSNFAKTLPLLRICVT